MNAHEFFDALIISNENDNVDMIQVLMGNDCLGTYFKNGTAKLYFQRGLKKNLEEQLQKINSNYPFQWKWEKLNKENWHLIWQENFQPVIIEKKLALNSNNSLVPQIYRNFGGNLMGEQAIFLIHRNA